MDPEAPAALGQGERVLHRHEASSDTGVSLRGSFYQPLPPRATALEPTTTARISGRRVR